MDFVESNDCFLCFLKSTVNPKLAVSAFFFQDYVAFLDEPVVKLPRRIKAAALAFLPCLLILRGTLRLLCKLNLAGAFDVFAEFSAFVFHVAF